MVSEEQTNKSWLKTIFGNSYLAFGLGMVAGFTIDNLMIVLGIAAVLGLVQWYWKSKKEEDPLDD